MKFQYFQIRCCRKTVSAVILLLSLCNFAHGGSSSSVQKLSNEIVGASDNQQNHIGSSSALPSSVSSSISSSPVLISKPLAASNRPSVSTGHYRDYGSAYYYPGQKHVVWNRDSYADAASDFGYNPTNQQAVGSSHATSQSYAPTSEYGVPEGNSYGDEDGAGGIGGGLGGIGGLGGLAGILGIKGIKGLGLLGILKAGLPLFGLLLPGLLLLPLIFLFLPVPVITIPSNPPGRSLSSGFRFGDMGAKVSQLARSVLESEKCVERMSCEISRVSRGTVFDKTLKRMLSKFETNLPKPLLRMARAYLDQSSHCNKKYACYLVDDNNPSRASKSS